MKFIKYFALVCFAVLAPTQEQLQCFLKRWDSKIYMIRKLDAYYRISTWAELFTEAIDYIDSNGSLHGSILNRAVPLTKEDFLAIQDVVTSWIISQYKPAVILPTGKVSHVETPIKLTTEIARNIQKQLVAVSMQDPKGYYYNIPNKALYMSILFGTSGTDIDWNSIHVDFRHLKQM